MLGEIGFRIGVILAFLLVVLGVTFVVEKVSPPRNASIPMAAPQLDASLYDPDMLVQYELLRSSGRLTAGQSGQVTGYYRSAEGQVALSMADIELLNQNYRADKRALDDALAETAVAEDYRAEALEEAGWGAGTSH
jgi:hypothetical protein